MPRGPFSTRPRRNRLIDRCMHEVVLYGGELWTREEIIRDLKRQGLDVRCIDRYLQGSELPQRMDRQCLPLEPPPTLLQ